MLCRTQQQQLVRPVAARACVVIQGVWLLLRFYRTLQYFNGLDQILLKVNNAGSDQMKGIMDVEIEDLEKMLDVHLKGPFNITQRTLPTITKSKGELFEFYFFNIECIFRFIIS